MARFTLLPLVVLLGLTGCSNLNLPRFPFNTPPPSPYVGLDNAYELAPEDAESIYRGVRTALAHRAVVLQVVGDSQPVRSMPLPPAPNTAYVSELLTQTGVFEELGAIEATLFRYSSKAIGGIRMEIQMQKSGQAVRPESDYALQPGDRIRVRRSTRSAAMEMLTSSLGL